MWPRECLQTGTTDVATLTCIPYIFQNILIWAVGLAGTVAVFFIIFSGIKFLTSGGDPKQVEGARKTLTYAIIGFILVISAFVIINIISAATGVTCIKQFGFGNCN